jgi:AraC-like DNA-binding protein
MLHAAGLSGVCLKEPDLRIPVDRVCALLEASARNAHCTTFGLALAQHRRLSHLGELGLLLRDLPTLRDIAEATAQFVRFHNESLIYAMEQHDGTVHILMESRVTAGIAPRQFCEFIIGSAFRIFQSLFANDWYQLRVCFRHSAPADTRAHAQFFGHVPMFSHEFNGFMFPTSLLDRSNPVAEPVFSLYTRNMVAAKVGSTSESRADEVRRVVLQLLPTGRCDAEHVAECLGVDRRTVHRQLAREGTTVSALVEDVRSELGRRYVLGSSMSISEIAPLFGFNSASAMVNWYRRRNGLSPTQHRRMQLEPVKS